MESMETWDVEKTTAWFCKIGLDKYGTICQEEDINGRALLLIGCKGLDQLVSAFQLKKGPQKILMNKLQAHMDVFNQSKLQTAPSSKEIREWTVEELCNWLGELGIPEECVVIVREEEINGEAFLLYRESGELKECLKLKMGTWIVLEHEVLLHLEKSCHSERVTTTTVSTTKNIQPMPTSAANTVETKEEKECKEPLAASDPTIKSVLEPPPKVNLSKEEERLSLLQNALQLDIDACSGIEDPEECVTVRSIFVKRGKGANALEKLFNFIVVTKDEMAGDKPRKLWSKIREKTADWIKLLPAKESRSFLPYCDSKSFVHEPTKEKVCLREDGTVGQIFLEKLSDEEFRKSLFVILVDKLLLNEKKTITYNFCLDKKHKHCYSMKLSMKETKYHASFDTTNPGLDLKWSKHFKTLTVDSGVPDKDASDHSLDERKPSSTRDILRQTPRPFASEFSGKWYSEGFILDSWETGSKDLIKPAHEFKLLQTGIKNSEDDSVKKFVYETLRFACGCLNERTNGTIHFGVADEVEGQTCGYQPREIVGSCVTDKPRYNEKLTEFIDKCFVGDSRSNVHNCIRPPSFISVKRTVSDMHTDDKVIIEVDIEPRYSFCAGEIFKVGFKGLDRGKEEPRFFRRHGSQTKAIVDVTEMKEFVKNHLPKLDEERKRLETQHDTFQGMEKQDSLKNLHGKLKRLLCANKNVLDSSKYPILVLSKPHASVDQDFLDETFCFIQNINWHVIIDFDDEGSDSNGLCRVFKSGPETLQFDIHEAEDYVDETVIDGIDSRAHWIFANGYAKLGKAAVGFKEWNNSDRKKGLSLVMQSLAKKIPDVRAVVLFLLVSNEYEPMADTFKDFCTVLGGPNQLVYVAENFEIVKDWEAKLLTTCLDEHQLRERGVVGMSWSEFKECMLQMVSGIDRDQRFVIMATGTPYPVKNVSFNNIEIVSAKECDELRKLEPTERRKASSEVEVNFYRGYPVKWSNFWFTDDQKNHVLRRDNYSDLKQLIQELHSQGSKGKVQKITIYHHIGAGASTMARQVLWDFRCNTGSPYRCAVVTKIDNSTASELLRLRKIGYGEESEVIPPVLALVDDTDDALFEALYSQVVEHTNKLPVAKGPVCVFLYCKDTQEPYKCHLKDKEIGKGSVFLEQRLSKREVDWFKDKYIDMQGQFHNKDPNRDFQTYANENLLSFMIMKENFNRQYASSIVERNLSQVTDEEFRLLEYTSLLSIYNPNSGWGYGVFTSCFDTVMLSASLLRTKQYLDWVECLTHSARIFLREYDRSTHYGSGKAIAIIHPIIAGELLDHMAKRKSTTVSQIAVDFLKSPLVENKGQSFALKILRDDANKMLKHRKKYEYGDDVQTKFSPLIEKILYSKDSEDKYGKKIATERSIDQAAEVLREGLDKFKDSMLAQQLARVFYVNVAAFAESKIDICFDKAHTFCKTAIAMDPNNSFYLDTMGRIHKKKIEVLYHRIRKENRIIEIEAATPVLSLAFDAMKWFQKSQAASIDCHNSCGFRGELSVMFYMLDILRCARIFRGHDGMKVLQDYLAFCQVVPPEVETLWKDCHESIKNLRNRYRCCIEGLVEDFAIYKVDSSEERMLPRQIATFKKQYYSYFGDVDVKWNTEIPEERWEHRWCQINQYLAGDIFGVFSIHRTKDTTKERLPTETLQELRKLAYENYCESIHNTHYNDLLLIISTGMALHSPYGKISKSKSAQTIDEYKEIYSFVERLFALEQGDGRHKRIYAHLFKVMFLWPRKDLDLAVSGYRVQDFYDALEKLRKRWKIKCKEYIDTDKLQKHKMYKNMTFTQPTRQYTTLFYLGKGTGLDVFVHINELMDRGFLDWQKRQIKQRLKRLTGVVQSKNFIRVQNPLESSRAIDVYYSSFREGDRFSKEEVSFYLGFSWPQPTAFDVKYTSTDPTKRADPVLEDQMKFVESSYDVFTYERYISQMGKLSKKLAEIDDLKKRKAGGLKLDENQVTNVSGCIRAPMCCFNFL